LKDNNIGFATSFVLCIIDSWGLSDPPPKPKMHRHRPDVEEQEPLLSQDSEEAKLSRWDRVRSAWKRHEMNWLLAELTIVGAVCFLMASILHNRMCDVVFHCGCTWDWDGGWAKYERVVIRSAQRY
jgi:hypothetical protein